MSSDSLHKNHQFLFITDNEAAPHDSRKVLAARADKATLDKLESAVLGSSGVRAEKINGDSRPVPPTSDTLEQILKKAKAPGSLALAFVDMRKLPGSPGLEALERVWNIDPTIQIMVCTAYTDEEWAEIQRRFGCSDCMLLLKKPVEGVEMTQLATAMNEKWKSARQSLLKAQELEEIVKERTNALRLANEKLEEQIFQKEAAEERLRYEAHFDSLTGLPNRALLIDRLGRCVERVRRESKNSSALLFLDVDNFKLINDSLGHAAGDELLKGIADRLQSTVRSVDSVSRMAKELTARLGGDEFVILLDGIRNKEEASMVAERIQKKIGAPYDICGHEIVVTTSVGIAIIDGSSNAGADLLRDADIAMYKAKSAGKARHAVFDEGMHAAAVARLQLENDLRRGIDEKQFLLEYQPIVEVDTARVAGFEALVRWKHPTRGILQPLEFIPVTEETGLIVPLGAWILEEASRQSAIWNAGRKPKDILPISVNISKRQVMQSDFIEVIRGTIKKTGVRPNMIRCEITESVIMANPDTIVEKLEQIRELGLGLHMDDFGTGQSSLGCLQNFPFDVLKIDKSFVQCMARDKKYVAITHAIINLAHNLNMKIVAEGVEAYEQLAQLVALNCDYGQGFLFSKPLSADKAFAIVKNPTLAHVRVEGPQPVCV